jgi:hypothetical protein
MQRKTWIVIVLAAVVLLGGTGLARAQGVPSPAGPGQPDFPAAPPVEAQGPHAQNPPDPARARAVIAAREARVRQEHPDYDPERTAREPKPPDDIPAHILNQHRPPIAPANPRPQEPPRRGENPLEPVVRLLTLALAPEGQSPIYCGAGTNYYKPAYWYEYVRGFEFCHSPNSFFTRQSMEGLNSSWRCTIVCSEVQGEQVYGCGRWVYDWQGWYCPYEPDYAIHYLQCTVWSRTLDFIYGADPLGTEYRYVTSTPWAQGCPTL